MNTCSCQGCENPVVVRGLCKPCYNKEYWSSATPEQLQKRRDSVSENYNLKKQRQFVRKTKLNPTPEETRQRVNEFVRNQRAYAKHVIDQVKVALGCVDCGYNTDPIALDFDHVTGQKEMNVSKAVSRCWSLDRIFEEISKCEVRCSNCHRIVTAQRRN